MTNSPIKNIFLCADANPQMGTGHVMRCMALAQWASTHAPHASCTLLGHIQVAWVRERLQQERIAHIHLTSTHTHEQSKAFLQKLAQAPQDSWIVLDGYHFAVDFQKALRNMNHKLLVIDDFAHLPEYSCDILLNPNIGAEEYAYKGDIGRILLGPEYTLLRPEFIKAKQTQDLTSKNDSSPHILISLGGGNSEKYLSHIASLFTAPQLSKCTLHIIVGAMQPEKILWHFKHSTAKIQLLTNVSDMPSLLHKMTFCFSAGGSTCWELCFSHLPFAVFSIAENQNRIVDLLIQQGIALDGKKIQLQDIVCFLNNKTIQSQYTTRGAQLIDGHGAEKCLWAMHTFPHSLQLRQATAADKDFIFSLANTPSVRSVSFQQKNIPYHEHSKWFTRQLKEKLPFYILEVEKQACGYIRFNATQNSAKISIALAENVRNKGLGTKAVQLACQYLFATTSVKKIQALIQKKNTASIKAFQKASFTNISSSQTDIHIMERTR